MFKRQTQFILEVKQAQYDIDKDFVKNVLYKKQ